MTSRRRAVQRVPRRNTFSGRALSGKGIARAAVTRDRWWTSGFEMLLVGGFVALAAYGAGALVMAATR